MKLLKRIYVSELILFYDKFNKYTNNNSKNNKERRNLISNKNIIKKDHLEKKKQNKKYIKKRKEKKEKINKQRIKEKQIKNQINFDRKNKIYNNDEMHYLNNPDYHIDLHLDDNNLDDYWLEYLREYFPFEYYDHLDYINDPNNYDDIDDPYDYLLSND